MSAEQDTLAAVDQSWRDARSIHAKCGFWDLSSIRWHLRSLARVGAIEVRAIGTRYGTNSWEYRQLDAAPEAIHIV